MTEKQESVESGEQIKRNIQVMAILHFHAFGLPLNCTLDEFCETTKDFSCPQARKRQYFTKYRKEILALVRQWVLKSQQEAKDALDKACEVRDKRLPINPQWRIKQESGKTWEEERIDELEHEFAIATKRLKLKE